MLNFDNQGGNQILEETRYKIKTLQRYKPTEVRGKKRKKPENKFLERDRSEVIACKTSASVQYTPKLLQSTDYSDLCCKRSEAAEGAFFLFALNQHT